jgi:hypothetical protein
VKQKVTLKDKKKLRTQKNKKINDVSSKKGKAIPVPDHGGQ